MSDDIPPSGNNAQAQIKSIVQRVQKMNEEKKAINDDIADIFTEARHAGYDVGALKELIRLLKMDPEDRKERSALVESYGNAFGA